MNIKFKSIITRDGEEDQIIEFTAKSKITEKSGFKSWEFIEPSKNIMNLVEATNDKVNIFAGSQTIQLKLKDRVSCEYFQQGMPQAIYFDSFLNSVEIKDNGVVVDYTLWNGQTILGNYLLTIEEK